MSSVTPLGDATASLRSRILEDPAIILDDRQILEALVRAQDGEHGNNVVDLRGLAMSRLELRLDRLEDTHQTVVAAAYDNVSITRQVHRAILTLLEPLDFESFAVVLDSAVRDCLRLSAVRIVLESADVQALDDPGTGAITLVQEDFVANLLAHGRRGAVKDVVLRRVNHGLPLIYGDLAGEIRSEALMRLDLGPDRLPGLLVLGAPAPDHFGPGQGTELLELFGRIVERLLRGWLG